MEITDEVRVVIAACAVRLILHLDLSYYDRLTEIIVYPYIYQHPEDEAAILGEADDWGTVVLSWPTVLEDLAQPGQGMTRLRTSLPTSSTGWVTGPWTEPPSSNPVQTTDRGRRS
jgi:hypothetical protein